MATFMVFMFREEEVYRLWHPYKYLTWAKKAGQSNMGKVFDRFVIKSYDGYVLFGKDESGKSVDLGKVVFDSAA